MLSYYLTTLSIIPLLTARAFMPIFATACFARWGRHLDWTWMGFIKAYSGVHLLDNIPAWALEDTTLIILGVLAAIELGMQKVPEFRDLMVGYTDATIKGIGAGIICFMMVDGNITELVAVVLQEGDLTSFRWGQSFQYTWSFGVGLATCFFAATRAALYEFLIETDPDDDMGVQGFMSWAEDGVGFIGVFFLVVIPVLTVVVSVAALVTSYLVLKALEASEKRQHLPCEHCQTPIMPCALECSECRKPVSAPKQVTVLGIVKDDPVVDRSLHRLELASRRRCPSCGVRLKERDVNQHCTSCDTRVFQSNEELERFQDHVAGRLLPTLAILFLLSFVPILGLFPGVIYYRLSLINSLRCYVPRSQNILVRWTLRLIFFVLILFQFLPVLGAFMLPTMCLVNYMVSRRALSAQTVEATPAPEIAPEAAPAQAALPPALDGAEAPEPG